eukprot:RCo011477
MQPREVRGGPRPPQVTVGSQVGILLSTVRGMAGGDGRHQGAVQAPAEKHPARHVGHHVPHHGRLEGLAQLQPSHPPLGDDVNVDPHWGVEPLHAGGTAAVHMPGREVLELLAVVLQGLQLTGEPHGAVSAVADVQRDDPDGVPGRDERVRGGVVQYKGVHTIDRDFLQEVLPVLRIGVDQALAVGVGKPGVGSGELGPDGTVVVDLRVDRQHQGAGLVVQGLPPIVHPDNRQPLVADDIRPLAVHPAPVRASVSQQTAEMKGSLPQGVSSLGNAQDRKNAAHRRSHKAEKESPSPPTKETKKGFCPCTPVTRTPSAANKKQNRKND